jgi:photosystem II stability/assembly factor-like uncharacterized protein
MFKLAGLSIYKINIKMKKTTILLVVILCITNITNSFSQTWITQGANISGSGLFIGDITAVDDNIVWAIAASNVGGICGTPSTKFTKTTNGGATWKSGNVAMPPDYILWNITAIDSLTAWVAAFDFFDYTNGRIYKTTNGGVTWTYQPTAVFPKTCQFVHFFNANEGVCIGANMVYTTTNGGTNWIAQNLMPAPANMNTLYNINCYEVVGNTIWLGGDTRLFQSMDKGITWTMKTDQFSVLGYPNIKGISFKDSLNGMVTTSKYKSGGNGPGANFDDGLFFKTNDGGATWDTVFYKPSNASQYFPHDLAKYDIAYIPQTANSYIVTCCYDNLHQTSAITTDGGNTWTMLDSTVAHAALAFTPSGVGWSGGNISSVNDGIYKFKANNFPAGLETLQAQLNKDVELLYDGDNVLIKNNALLFKISSLDIINLAGEIIYHQPVSNNKLIPLPTKNLNAGMYIVFISDGKNTISKKMVLK